MKAMVVTDQAAGKAGVKLAERPEPQAAINDVVVQIHASGFTGDELSWPSTWTDRVGRDRTPSIPGHEMSGVVTALGYGTTGLSIGQRVFGITDWYRDGTLAEYVAVEARNLTPLPGDVDFTVGAALVMPGLTAWQGLFEHGRLRAGQSVLVHGAAGVVGSMASQLAREAGAYVIGTGRADGRQTALDFGAQEFVDLDNDALEDVGEVDLVFDVIGGDIGKRSAGLIRAGGMLVTVTGPTEARPSGGLTIDFVVVPDRAQLSELVQRVRDGRLRTNIGNVAALDDAVAAFNPTKRIKGKTIIRVHPVRTRGLPNAHEATFRAPKESFDGEQITPTVFYRTVNVEGLEIFYREAGPPDAPTVLLLHGFPSSSHMFRNLIPMLADKYHVIAPDFPGYGESSAPSVNDFDYSYERLAAVTEKFTEKLNLSSYALYLSDIGSSVGFRLAVMHPERVTAMIVQNGDAHVEAINKEFAKGLLNYWEDRSEKNAQVLLDWLLTIEGTKYHYLHGVRDPSKISPDNWVIDQALEDRPGNKEIQLSILYNAKRNLDVYADWQEYFRKQQPPMLITWGKNDGIFTVEGAELYKRDIPSAELHLLDTGHFALEEEGGRIGALMHEFLDRRLPSELPRQPMPSK